MDMDSGNPTDCGYENVYVEQSYALTNNFDGSTLLQNMRIHSEIRPTDSTVIRRKSQTYRKFHMYEV